MAGARRDDELDYCDDGFNEEDTVSEIRNKYRHLRRLAEGTSRPFMKSHSPDEFFADVYPEFLNYFSRGQLQHLEKLFLMSDHDGDGQLNKFEVKYWMEKQGNPITQQEVKEIFSVADENKDGYLSFREFLIFCKRIEVKDIPSDQGSKIQGIVEDPTGQGAKYPPRHPCENGVGKISTKLKSYTKVQANIGGAVAFFESEIAKEIESCQRDRQTYDAAMEQKRGGYRNNKEPKPAKPSQEFAPAPQQRYRTSLHMDIQENEQPVLSGNRYYYQDQRVPSDSKPKDMKGLPPNTWNAEIAKNTYKPSLPFVNHINQAGQSRLKPTNFDDRRTYPGAGNKPGQRKYWEMSPRNTNPDKNIYQKSPTPSSTDEAQVIYESSGEVQKPSDTKLHSGFSGPIIPVPPPLPLPPQESSNKNENNFTKNAEPNEESTPSKAWWNWW